MDEQAQMNDVMMQAFEDELSKIAFSKESIGGRILAPGSMPLQSRSGSIGVDPRFEGMQAGMHDQNHMVNSMKSAPARAAPAVAYGGHKGPAMATKGIELAAKPGQAAAKAVTNAASAVTSKAAPAAAAAGGLGQRFMQGVRGLFGGAGRTLAHAG
jgi:hypothetical protein